MAMSQLEQTDRIVSLKSEIKSYQKIIDKQQKQLHQEVQKREQAERCLNEESVLDKIQLLLKAEQPDLEELMGLSLR